MKRWALLLGALFLLTPNRSGTDVAKLRPVQALWMTTENGLVILSTDSGDVGIGTNFASALQDMEKSAASQIFYSTTEYLLLTGDALGQIHQAAEYLRLSCVVCLTEGEPVMNQAAQFLEQHHAQTTLQQYRADGRTLPLLRTEEGRMTLVS